MKGIVPCQSPTSWTRAMCSLRSLAQTRAPPARSERGSLQASPRPSPWQELERHQLVQIEVRRHDHDAHAPAAEHALHAVLALDDRPPAAGRRAGRRRCSSRSPRPRSRRSALASSTCSTTRCLRSVVLAIRVRRTPSLAGMRPRWQPRWQLSCAACCRPLALSIQGADTHGGHQAHTPHGSSQAPPSGALRGDGGCGARGRRARVRRRGVRGGDDEPDRRGGGDQRGLALPVLPEQGRDRRRARAPLPGRQARFRGKAARGGR